MSDIPLDVQINVLDPFIYTDTSLEECIKDYRCIKIIMNHPRFNIQNALDYCAKYGYLEEVKHLISAGANVNLNGGQPVLIASKGGYLELVKYLVSVGADITARGNLAVQWASKNGHLETVNYLVSLGAVVRSDSIEMVTSGSFWTPTPRYREQQRILNKQRDK